MQFVDYGYIKASKLGIGTASFGSKISEAKALKVLDDLFANQVNYIDTANSYGLGNSEKIIGSFIRKNREQFFISTKVGIKATKLPFHKKLLLPIVRSLYHSAFIKNRIQRQSAQSYQHEILSVEEFKVNIERSLENLKTDYLDQLLIHNNFATYLNTPSIVDVLRGFKQKGIIKQIGITTHEIDPFVLREIEKFNTLIDTVQVPFSAHSVGIGSKFYINYFSVFSQSTTFDYDNLVLKIKNHSKGHFIIAMSSPETIKKNLMLFS